jgi:hypothetical protein
VRQLQRDHPALHNVIDRLQREEKEHWAIVLELQRVELALVKHVQKEAVEEEQKQQSIIIIIIINIIIMKKRSMKR